VTGEVLGTVVLAGVPTAFVFDPVTDGLQLNEYRHNPVQNVPPPNELVPLLASILAAVRAAAGEGDPAARDDFDIRVGWYWCSECRSWLRLDGTGWSYGVCMSCSMDRASEMADYYRDEDD